VAGGGGEYAAAGGINHEIASASAALMAHRRVLHTALLAFFAHRLAFLQTLRSAS
jgi:hypothetical protein